MNRAAVAEWPSLADRVPAHAVVTAVMAAAEWHRGKVAVADDDEVDALPGLLHLRAGTLGSCRRADQGAVVVEHEQANG